ncbi:MAG: hypothetical protein ABIJ75_02460 [Actinomycetota bacterium]
MANQRALRTSDLNGVPPVLRAFLQNFIWGVMDGAPTDGTTGRNKAPIGALLFDRTNGVVYINSGTKASPAWNSLGGVAAGEITLATGSILLGTAGVGAALDAKTSGQILVGSGTTLASVAVSGDATLAANGALTIGADKIDETNMDMSLPFTIGLPFTLADRGGPSSNWMMVGTLTASAVSAAIAYDLSTTTYTDKTTEANEATQNDVEIPDPFDTGDLLYIGGSDVFSLVKIKVGTQGVGDAVAAETDWEYWNGAAWATLTEQIDSSVALTAGAATHFLSFLPPADWAATTINSQGPFYFIRMVSSADDVYNTTQPKVDQIWVGLHSAGSGVTIPFAGTISAVDMLAFTASATNNDTELLLINTTTGLFEQLTWTGADVADRVTGLALVCSAGDQLAVQVIAEDGSTEFALGQLVCQVDF